MKKKALSSNYIILRKICQALASLVLVIASILVASAAPYQPANAVDTENYEYESFDADYYLTKDEQGISHLRVVESFTALFPEYNQNKGICRQIPFINQSGRNTTLPRLGYSDIILTRNGQPEPIYSIDRGSGYYTVCTGTDDYVLGRQKYTFEYNFEKVITDFGNYQELYWDTNGTNNRHTFGTVTARVHFADETSRSAFTGEKWCYVGRYGVKGDGRCTISEIDDGLQFEAKNLGRYENLTFDIEFKPGSFLVPEPEKDYLFVVIMIIAIIAACLLLIKPAKRFLATSEKRSYYKGLFVKPEYQAPENYTISEMYGNYMGKKKDLKVALLLEMIIKKQIALKKIPADGALKRDKWEVEVVDESNISHEGRKVLEILNGGKDITKGSIIEIKKRTATAKMASLGQEFDNAVRDDAMNAGLTEDVKASVGLIWVFVLIAAAILLEFPDTLSSFLGDANSQITVGKIMVGQSELIPVLATTFAAYIIIRAILLHFAKKFEAHTMNGLKMSVYMDGLKLYIGMAEADRMAVLQSVKGADTSPTGIVKLYEKLLPYAAIFGLEKSWMEEFEKYCAVHNVQDISWRSNNFDVMDAVIISNMMSSYATNSIHYSSSSGGGGGSWSSGSSGGGGGGFSGGGGGGGGSFGR